MGVRAVGRGYYASGTGVEQGTTRRGRSGVIYMTESQGAFERGGAEIARGWGAVFLCSVFVRYELT